MVKLNDLNLTLGIMNSEAGIVLIVSTEILISLSLDVFIKLFL